MAVKTVVLSMLQVKAVGGNPTFAFKRPFLIAESVSCSWLLVPQQVLQDLCAEIQYRSHIIKLNK